MNKKLICFTYAGGSADFYKGLTSELAHESIDVIALEYAGHGIRRKEAMYNNFDDLALDMTNQLMQVVSEEEQYSLMGYSMGTIAVVEVLKQLIRLQTKMPDSVILAAHEPKAKAELADWSKDIQDELVKERIARFGGVPESLLANKTFWRMYLPIYRNDFNLIGQYNFDNLYLKTDIPALIMYSEADTPFYEVEKWNRYFTGDNLFQEYSGNHFFINDHISEASIIIAQWIKEDYR